MKYPMKVWIFTIFLSPFLLFIRLWDFASDNGSEVTQGIAFLLLAILFGAGFSLPALFLFNLLYKDLRYSALNKWVQKLIFGFMGVVLIWATFFLIDKKFIVDAEFNNIIWPIVYSFCLVVGAFIFSSQNEKERSMLLEMRTTQASQNTGGSTSAEQTNSI